MQGNFLPYWIKNSDSAAVSKLIVIEYIVGLPKITVPGKGALFRITGVKEGIIGFCSITGVEVLDWVVSLEGAMAQPTIRATGMNNAII